MTHFEKKNVFFSFPRTWSMGRNGVLANLPPGFWLTNAHEKTQKLFFKGTF